MSDSATIRRASHPLAREVRRLASSAQARHERGLFLCDGPRVLGAALDAGRVPDRLLVAADGVARSVLELVERADGRGAEIVTVAANLLQRLAPSSTGQGVIGLYRLPAGAGDPGRVLGLGGAARIVVAWQMQDPGNLGTLIRSTAALGGRGLLAVGGADPWGPKAVRASAGALFHLPAARRTGVEPAALVSALREAGFQLVTAAAHGGFEPGEIDWSARSALILGAEVAGLPRELTAASRAVTIPLDAPSESLSVAAAGAVLLDRARVRAPAPEAEP
jgi:TrmH family RNA methyltransferase